MINLLLFLLVACASSASAPWRTGAGNADPFGRAQGAVKRLSDVAMDAPSSWQPNTNASEKLAPAFPPAGRCRGAKPELAKYGLSKFVYKRLGGNPSVALDDVKLVRCQAPDPSAGRGTQWSIQRVGPFELQGGGDDMHIFSWGGVGAGWLDAAMDLAPEHGGDADSQGRARFVTGTFIDVVDDDGAPLGNPPAHLHHIHLGWVHHDRDGYERRGAKSGRWVGKGGDGGKNADDARFNSGDWFEQRHGDSECLAADGGTACLGQAYPNGTGVRVRREYDNPAGTPGVDQVESEAFSPGLFIDGMVNDGRPKELAAAPARFWVEVAIRWTAVAQRPVGLRNMGSPFCMQSGGVAGGGAVGEGGESDGDFSAWAAGAQAMATQVSYPETLSNAALFYVPETSPSVLWYTFRVPDRAGRYLWTTFHAHAHWFKSSWLFTGLDQKTLAHIGMCNADQRSDRGKKAEDRCWVELPSANIPARLRFDDAPAAAHGPKLSVAQFERRLAAAVAEQRGGRKVCEFTRSLETVGGHTYDRRSQGGCDPSWRVTEGQVVTVVALYQPSEDVRREQKSEVAKLAGKSDDLRGERSAMAFKIGTRGVPEHAIFRGLYEDASPKAAVAPGDGNWGVPIPNKCFVTEEEEQQSGTGGAVVGAVGSAWTGGAVVGTAKGSNKDQKGKRLHSMCWSCVQGPCKACRECFKTVNGKHVGIDGGRCAPCWLGKACLHDTVVDCRMCWGFPPKKGKAIDAILARLNLSREDWKR